MMKRHKVQINQELNNTRVYVDGKEINTHKVEVHMDRESIPETEISVCGDLEMDYETLVTFEFSPKTIKTAVNVLKAGLVKNDFVAFMGLNELNKVMHDR